jgi:hypothetical protein
MLSLTFMAGLIAVVVRDAVRKDVNKQLEVIRDQNSRSINDRLHLNIELDNTRESLKRLEMAVKTGHYP